MAGPIENLAPGNSCVTAWAMHMSRRVAQHVATRVGIVRDDGELVAVVQLAAEVDLVRRRPDLAATAALASRLPIDDATSRAVVPAATSRAEPSGSVIVIGGLMTAQVYERARARRTGGIEAGTPTPKRDRAAGSASRPGGRLVDVRVDEPPRGLGAARRPCPEYVLTYS